MFLELLQKFIEKEMRFWSIFKSYGVEGHSSNKYNKGEGKLVKTNFNFKIQYRILEVFIMSDKRNELITERPIKLMFKLCIPAIVGMIVIGLYTFMDGVYAGQMIGEYAMAAISVAYPITFINSGVATLIGIGSASVLSRAIGKKDQETIDKIMPNLAALVLIISSIITVLAIIFAEQLLRLTGATGEILKYATDYLRIVFCASIFVNFTQSANMVMRGEGLMKKAMLIMGFGAIMNIILDPIMITLMPNKGVNGVAIATIISQILQALVTLSYFLRKSKNVKLTGVKLEKKLTKEVFAIGVSAMLMQILSMIQQTLFFRMAFKYGGDASGVIMSASLRLQAFTFIPLWGMSQGLQPIVGTNYGAKKFERVKKSMNLFMMASTILALIFWAPIQLMPETFLGLFIKDSSIVVQGANKFRIFYSVFIVYGLVIMITTFFQAIGHGKRAGQLVILRQFILFVPTVILLPKFLGESALWYVAPIVDFTVIVICMIFLKKEYSKLSVHEVACK